MNKDLSKFSVDFSGGELVELQSNLAAGGRAMELSELRHQFMASPARFAVPDPNPDSDPPDPNVFWASWIRIRILLSSCKNSKKNLDFVTLFDFLCLKNDVNVTLKKISRTYCVKKLVFGWHLEGQ